MEVRLERLAAQLGGKVVGNGNLPISGVGSLADAQPGQITFLTDTRYRKLLKDCRASALIAGQQEEFAGAQLIHPNPYLAFALAIKLFQGEQRIPPGISGQAFVSPSAQIGQGVSIFPLVYVGDGVKLGDRVVLYPGVFLGDNVAIGEDSLIYANVSIRENCLIGKRVIVHCGAVIGSDGFGFAKEGDKWVKVPQLGNVKLEDDVEIGANVSIDRAVLGTTLIKRGVKVDNLVQLAHNVVVGDDSLLVAQVGISGSTQLGRGVILGGQVGVAGHLCIGDKVTVGGQSGVTKDLPSGVTVAGLPAIAHQQWKRAQMSFVKLPELRKRFAALEKRLVKLEERLKNA
jgi:UDP-3-O-[3-hydroxymyristoyl] glucosamine N-acyltransferase